MKLNSKVVCFFKIYPYICSRLKAMNDLVAQLVEHLPFKEVVLGSSPSPVTKTSLNNGEVF